MFFVENIELFLSQQHLHGRIEIHEKEASTIVARARMLAAQNKKKNVLKHEQSEEIFENEQLSRNFKRALDWNQDQIMITSELLRKMSGMA